MDPAERKPWLLPSLAGFLVLAFLVQCFLASRAKSPAWDETGDIAAGLSYLLTDKFTVNLQHPPLLKELIGLSTLASGARWPNSPAAQHLLDGAAQYQWTVGNDIIAANGSEKVMFWARLPMILTGAMLALLLYFWGRLMVGGAAAVGAVFLYALDPTIVAHSYLTTLDVGFAAFTVLFLFSLWNYLRYPSRKRLMWCGVAMGAMLATKFSALVLLPVAGVLILAAVWRPPAQAGKAPRSFLNPYSSGKTASAKAAPNDPCPCGSGRKFKKCHGETGAAPAAAASLSSPMQKVYASLLAFALLCLVAVVVVEALYFFPSDPFLYLKGMRLVNADHASSYGVYLGGKLQTRFLSYFAVAWLLKEPVASIVLVILGVAMVVRSKTLETLDKLFLLLPPAALFAAHTLLADNIGFRYIIPVLPLAYLSGGVGLAALICSETVWKRAAAGILCVWMIVAAIGIYPDHLSYFNEAACLLENPAQIGLDGGSRCGPAWLDDSNVDWGEGLKQLRDWWNLHATGRTMRLGYFGSFPPEYYGLLHESIDIPDLLVMTPKPGLYVVSAHMVARGPAFGKNGTGAWLRRIAPTAIVGHCLYVYDIK